MNTYGHNLSRWGEIHMEDFKRFNCLPDKCIDRYIQYHTNELDAAFQPLFMALSLAGKPIPIMVGISHDRSVTYWIELKSGFCSILVKPVSYWLLWDRYKIKHYFGVDKDKLYTLDEVVQEFAEVYDKLGDRTIANA